MKFKKIILLLFFPLWGLGGFSQTWVSDQGDGTYKNPILYADYSDPDVVRVGDDFYMTASSFTAVPGLPILHSKDLVNWKLINHAVQESVPTDVFNVPQHGNGIWAPSIRFHNNEFYIYWGDPDFGIYMVKTKDPYGNWEKPVLVMEGKGLIDACPLWDDNGNVYLVHAYAGSRASVKSILAINKMNAEGTQVLDKGVVVFDGHDAHPTVEGPKFYKRNGYYYIFAPAGGVATGWQLILRSKNIYGPYEEKVVLEQGSTKINGPHQGAWIDTPKGDDWFIHFQDVEAYGRIVHLQPVTWKNDWPLMGKDLDKNGIGEPVSSFSKPVLGMSVEAPVESDEFTSEKLGLQWQWQANPSVTWYSLIKDRGFLRLFTVKKGDDESNLWNQPNLLLQKFPAPNFKATTKLKLLPEEAENGKSAGLMVFGLDYATITLTYENGSYILKQTQALQAKKNNPEAVNEEVKLNTNEVILSVEVSAPNALCQFSYSLDGKKFIKIGKPFTAKPGQWVGAKVGVFSVSESGIKYGGYTDVDYFRITK
ncbi:MAG TPA: glycoside hydrolase 43 family protein [Flavobacteriaceae bacterium]|nr:glycoside hydrolase 43 family protein [Flavobacteriaceae bacterium]